MAFVSVTECVSIQDRGGNPIEVPDFSGGLTSYDVAHAASSAAFSEGTKFLLLMGDDAFRFAIGTAPAAGAGDTYWPAGVPLFIGVSVGEKISVAAA